MLEIDLMTNAGARRHHAEIVERPLPPAEKRIALAVALHLDAHIVGQGRAAAEAVDLDRMIDHQIGGHQRIDPLGIAAQRRHGIAHRRQIDDRGHTGEILHQHPRRAIGDLALDAAFRQPPDKRLDVVDANRGAVLEAQQVLEQNLERIRQSGNIADPGLDRGGKAEIIIVASANT